MTFVLAAALVLLGGVAIGASGIGGIVVVPVLTLLGGVEPARAVAAASLGFGFAGLAAVLRQGPGDPDGATPPHATAWRFGTPALAAAAAGAALGAATLAWLPGRAIALLVGSVALVSGAAALLRKTTERSRESSPAAMACVAFAVGVASAWSGTGGPVVLLPALAMIGWPTRPAIDAAQRVQLPVALAATAVNAVAGRLDLLLGAAIGALVLAGFAVGRRIARGLSADLLRQLVAIALLATGIATLTVSRS